MKSKHLLILLLLVLAFAGSAAAAVDIEAIISSMTLDEEIGPTDSITSPADRASLPAGDITINAIASDATGTITTVEFYEGQNYLGQDTTSPYSYTWTSVPDGCYTIKAKVINDVGDSNTDSVNITVGAGFSGQLPYRGSPFVLPAKIQAEDYDTGGEGIAYHDNDSGNSGEQYRFEGVDIEVCSDTGGGFSVGYMEAYEWIEYTVTVPAAGTYNISARVSSLSTGGTFRIYLGPSATGYINVPVTGSWQNWTTVSTTATLSAGTQVMRFVNSTSTTKKYNINYFEITPVMVTVPNVIGMSQASSQSAIIAAGFSLGTISYSFSNTVAAGNVVSQSPTGGTLVAPGSPVDTEISLGSITQLPYHGGPFVLPAKIQAEDYDIGGEGMAYHDTDTGNRGGQYRSEGVDIEGCSDTGGGYNVGFIEANEWMEYTVTVPAAGTYNINIRVSSRDTGGNFHIEFAGSDVTGNINVPVTGGWQNWTTVSATATLSEGTQIMRFANADSADEYNINYFNISFRGDLNDDGNVNLVDLQIMADEWATAGTQADIEPISGDGWVDFRDFVVLAQNWLVSN